MSTPVIGIAMLALTVAAVAGAGVFLVLAQLQSRPLGRIVTRLAVGCAAWAALYATLLVTTSLASEPRVLGINENKKFCGFYLDCHRQVAVVTVDSAAVSGAGAGAVHARGTFFVLTLRVSSDAARAPLQLAGIHAVLRDSAGRTFTRDERAERALASANRPSDAFARALLPGEERTVTIVFDVPGDARSLHLAVKAREPLDELIELFLIGDEDSVLHPPTVFRVAR